MLTTLPNLGQAAVRRSQIDDRVIPTPTVQRAYTKQIDNLFMTVEKGDLKQVLELRSQNIPLSARYNELFCVALNALSLAPHETERKEIVRMLYLAGVEDQSAIAAAKIAAVKRGDEQFISFLDVELAAPAVGLIEAAETGNIPLLRRFLLQPEYLDSKKTDGSGHSKLALTFRAASERPDLESLKAILEFHSISSDELSFAVTAAINQGDIPKLQFLMEQTSSSIFLRDESLFQAVTGDNPSVELLRFLLQNGANIHEVDYIHELGSTLSRLSIEVIEFLIDAGVKNLISHDSALTLTQHGEWEKASYVIKRGAKLKKSFSDEVLYWSTVNGEDGCGEFLKSQGLPAGKRKTSLLLSMAEEGSVERVRKLLEDGLDQQLSKTFSGIQKNTLGIFEESALEMYVEFLLYASRNRGTFLRLIEIARKRDSKHIRTELEEYASALIQVVSTAARSDLQKPELRKAVVLAVYATSKLDLSSVERATLAEKLYAAERCELQRAPIKKENAFAYLSNARNVQLIADAVREFCDLGLMGSEQVSNPLFWKDASEKEVKAATEVAYRETIDALFNDRSLSLIARFNNLWHRPDMRAPAHCRSLLSSGIWEDFLEPWTASNGIEILSLNTGADLVKEGKALEHCVGSGSYSQACLEGTSRILSVRQADLPIATIELRQSSSGALPGNSEQRWNVKQKFGLGNRPLPPSGVLAWAECEDAILNGNITLKAVNPVKLTGNRRLLPIEEVTGFPIGENPDPFSYCLGLHLGSKSQERIPFVPPSSAFYELLRRVVS